MQMHMARKNDGNNNLIIALRSVGNGFTDSGSYRRFELQYSYGHATVIFYL